MSLRRVRVKNENNNKLKKHIDFHDQQKQHPIGILTTQSTQSTQSKQSTQSTQSKQSTQRTQSTQSKQSTYPIVFHEHVSEILPGLWLGDIEASYNIDFLKSKNIECIFNCSQSIPFPDIKNIKYKYRVPVRDNLEKDQIDKLFQLLNTIVDKIQNHLPKYNILVHCHAGRQRSATVVVAYLIRFGKLTKKQAIDFLETKRPYVFKPMINFESAIDRYIQQIE